MDPKQFGLSPLALETSQRYLKNLKDLETKNAMLKIICLVLFAVACASVVLGIMLTHRTNILADENLEQSRIHHQILSLVESCLNFNSQHNEGNARNSSTNAFVERFAKIMDARPFQEQCPPCTTEAPVGVEPHRNPISVLNEATNLAEYDCSHICINPPIHETRLVVGDEHVKDKVFVGKGMSKQKSKQVAAYRALEYGFPEHLDDVAEEYIPDLTYNPPCQQQNSITAEKGAC